MQVNKPYIFIALFILLQVNEVIAQTDSIAQRIILIGDAGKQDNGKQAELEVIKKWFNLDKRTTVIFLGDNIYPQGLPYANAKNYNDKKQILDSQINIVAGTEATAYFIPGNHDWMQGRKYGYQQVLNQYRYIQTLQKPNVHYIPDEACPGPQEIKISDKITLVVIDSQWWLHKYYKPALGSGCEFDTEKQILEALEDIIKRNEDKLLVFAAHHPFITFGRHGGYYNLKQHIFPLTDLDPRLYIPLPVIGSIYPIARGIFGNIQDTRHPVYKNFSRSVDSILKLHPNCIRVAGHEHNLQLIEQKNQYYIGSGAGSKSSSVTKDDDLLFSYSKTGFATIDVIGNGNVYVNFFSSFNDTVTNPLYSKMLPRMDSMPVNRQRLIIPELPDSVTVAAADYYKAGRLKEWLLGKNYREEWMTPVTVKVFDIGKEKGGLKIVKRGGGMQTRSLQLEDREGREYVLRSVEKYPDATLPEEFRETIIKDAVVDAISASYPYAALSIPVLAAAAKVPHTVPLLVYLPDDPRFGYYQKDFANSLCIFEEREPAKYGENKSTDKVLDNIREKNENNIDQKAVLKARLLDMFIMDFDRHEDQWRWIIKDTGNGNIYSPLPRDRDQAFFVNMGVIPKMVSKPWRLPKFQGFRPKAIDIRTFNFNARYFDRTFLNSLTEQDWKNYADTLIMQMSDTVIEEALHRQPREIFPLSGDKIIRTLKERRKYLRDEAIQYYKFLAKEVEITGSDKKELFDVRTNEDGSVQVDVLQILSGGKPGNLLYRRLFLPSETEEIRLFGLGGEDSFYLTGSHIRKIMVRLSGGDGKDIYIAEAGSSKKNTVVYDFTGDKNKIAGSGHVKEQISQNHLINIYNRKTFRYNVLQRNIAAAYNRDDGLYLGATLKYTGHGFNKDPYRIMHQLTAQHALLTKAFSFQYNLIAAQAIGGSDFIIHANVMAPNNTVNFFGIGNNSVNEISNGKGALFYRTRFFHADMALFLRREIAPDIRLYYGPTIQTYSVNSDDNVGRIISYPELIGIDSLSMFKTRNYGGLATGLEIDNRNNPHYPTRGVKWKTFLQFNKGLGQNSSNFTQMSSDLSVYISSNIPPRMVVALRFGGAVNFGSYEFFQAQYLSGTDNLRGYRKNRFAGDRMFYNNLDIRLRLRDYKGYLFTGSYGVLLFHDVGRVWAKGESSARWHNGYGAGLWVSPARMFVVTTSYMWSKEGGLPLVSFGFQF